MAFSGKLIGALLGSLGGPMGSVLGGVVGHLFDQASEEHRSEGPAAAGDEPPSEEARGRARFLTTLIGLAVSAVRLEGPGRERRLAALTAWFQDRFPLPGADPGLIARLVGEAERNRERIPVEELCAWYRGVSRYEGRLLLVRLLFQAAGAVPGGEGGGEDARRIRQVTDLLGLREEDLRAIIAGPAGGESGPYAVLGLPPEADAGQVRAAWRRLARRHHPDRVAGLGEAAVRAAEERFRQARAAYEAIRRAQGW